MTIVDDVSGLMGQFFGQKTKQMFQDFYDEDHPGELIAASNEMLSGMLGVKNAAVYMDQITSKYPTITQESLPSAAKTTQRHDTFAFVVILAYIVCLIIAYSTTIIPEQSRLMVQNIVYLIGPLLATATGFYAIKKFGIKSVLGKTISYLTIGFFMFLISEIAWVIYENFLHIEPTDSLPGFLFFLAYPFFIAGILVQFDKHILFENKKRLIWSGASILVLIGISFYFTFYLGYNPQLPLVENIILLGYSIADMIIIIGLVIMINLSIHYAEGLLAKFWILLALTFSAQWIGDVLLAIFDVQYHVPVWAIRQIDYLWIVASLLAASAFYVQVSHLNKTLKEHLTPGAV